MKLDKKRITTLSFFALAVLAAFSAVFFQRSQSVQEGSCEVRRSAIDMGSGSTKLLVAEVDLCASAVKRVVHAESQKVDYKQSLLDHDQTFSDEVQQQGLKVLTRYLQLSEDLGGGASPLVISTAAFREAKNSAEFLRKIHSELALEVNIIDQPTEAALGFLSVLAAMDLERENTVVWDIGGGSQQISYFDGESIQAQLMDWGSISYKAKVLSALNRQGHSPNPLSWEEVVQVKPLARAETPWPAPGRTVVGVGGVFGKSLLPRLGGRDSKFHRLDLEDLLARSYFLTDSEIGGSYPETDVTNIILVLSLMEQFGVDEIVVADTGLLHGVLVYGLNGLRADR